MRVEKLEIKGFGKFNDFTLSLDSGINIIFGNNEGGKTTIQSFIKAMLFGLKSGRYSKDGMLPPSKKYKPWNGNEYNGFLEYRLANGEVYRVGRNFASNSVRIFDSLFNDITNTFDISKDKGVQFAERHMGVNETCFEKTAFIRQMDLKIDESGSSELLSRLANVSQTGFEDVSFMKAHKALREALKNYVGTDKTSTKPLDRIITRLDELKALKKAVIEKKDSLLAVENELTEALAARSDLEHKRTIMDMAKEIIDLRKSIGSSKKWQDELCEILRNISKEEDELSVISSRVEEFQKTRQKFARFSAYNEEDAHNLSTEYYKLSVLLEENKKLQIEKDNKTQAIDKIEIHTEPLKAFGNLGQSAENNVLEIKRDLETLKSESNKNSMDGINEKIKSTRYKDRLAIYGVITSIALTVISLAAGFLGFKTGFTVLLAIAPAALVILFVRANISKKLSILTREKRTAFANLNLITQEIKQKQKMLQDIFDASGVMSVEDFIRLKAVFDNRNEQLKDLKADAESLLNQLDKGSQKITELKNGIAQKLIIVGLEEEENLEINEEHVREFKYGINKYREVEPSINYAQQRSADLNADLQALYAKAASILRGNFGDKENLADSGENCSNKEQLIEEINKVSGRLEVQNEKLAEYMSQLKELFAAKGFPVSEFDSLSQRLLAQDPDEAGEVLKNDYNVVSGQLNNTLLKIRENETILKSMAIDSDEIQKIDEELAELESKKAKLKETEHSLKMALDILTESSTEIQKDFVPALNIRMSNIIYRISGGRYKDLRADGNLYLKAIAPETGDVVSSSALSEGTVDQVYLALRIAMAELVVPTGEKLPFIMDEAFAQYDDSRTRQTFEFFKELSSERQLIFFTCKRREVDIAREVFGGSINILEL